MRTSITFFLISFVLFSAVFAIAQDQLSIYDEAIPTEQIPNAPIIAYPNVACDGNSSWGFTQINDTPGYSIVATVALLNVGKNDVLVCNGTLQTKTEYTNAGDIAVRVEVRDDNGNIFYADPEPAGDWPYFAPAGEAANFRSGTWWINPFTKKGFVLGTVTLSLHARESPAGDSIMGFRSFCCHKISNSPTSQTKAVVVPLFD